MDWLEGHAINFLGYHTISIGVLLNYFVRDNANPIERNNPNFLDDYSNRTPLQGKVFTHDAAKVHSFIIYLISENTVAEQKFFPNNYNKNEQENFLTLKDSYERVGSNAKSVLSADN